VYTYAVLLELQSLRQQLQELNRQQAAASQSVSAAAALHSTAAAQLAYAQSQAAAAGATVDAATAKLPQQVTAATAATLADNNANSSRPPVVALSALQRGLSWQQTAEELSVNLKLPRTLKGAQLKVDVQSAALIARIAPAAVHSGLSAKQQPQGELLLRGRLWGRIASSDSTWWLEDSGTLLCFSLQKHHLQHTDTWDCLFENSEWEGGLHWSSYGNSTNTIDSSSTNASSAATTAVAGGTAAATDTGTTAATATATVDTTAGAAADPAAATVLPTVNISAVSSVQAPSAAAAAAPEFAIAAEVVEAAAAQAVATELAATATSAGTDTKKTSVPDVLTKPIVRAVSAMTAELQCSAADAASSSSNAVRLCVKYTLIGGCSDDRDYIAAYPCDCEASSSVTEIDETTYDCMEYLPDAAVGQCSGSVTLTLPAEAKAGAVYTIRYIAVQGSTDTADSTSTGASSAVQHVAIFAVPHAASIGATVYTVEQATATKLADSSSAASAKIVYRAPAKWLLEQQVFALCITTYYSVY
jgi:CS domain